MENRLRNRTGNTHKAQITAGICGLSDNHVRKVIRMERDNELVVAVYMTLSEGMDRAVEEAKQIAKELKTKNV